MAAAEMAFAGGLGIQIDLSCVPVDPSVTSDAQVVRLFAESNTRFLCEVSPDQAALFEETMGDVPHACVGSITVSGHCVIADASPLIDVPIDELREAWKAPLRW